MTEFQLAVWRLWFEPLAEVQLGDVMGAWRGKFGNALRSLSGDHACSPEGCGLAEPCLSARLFHGAVQRKRPSGFQSPPRPYALRSFHLRHRLLEARQRFHVDLHLFDVRTLDLDRPLLLNAFERMAETGLRAAGVRVPLRFLEVEDSGVHSFALPSTAPPSDLEFLTLEFQSPAQIDGRAPLSFPALIRRLRDRIATLAMFYGTPIEDCDFSAFADAAGDGSITLDQTEWVREHRNSTRTGQQHWLEGWVGRIGYEARWRGYAPWLTAGQYTGVGEQTAFGKGAYRIVTP